MAIWPIWGGYIQLPLPNRPGYTAYTHIHIHTHSPLLPTATIRNSIISPRPTNPTPPPTGATPSFRAPLISAALATVFCFAWCLIFFALCAYCKVDSVSAENRDGEAARPEGGGTFLNLRKWEWRMGAVGRSDKNPQSINKTNTQQQKINT